MFLHRTGACIVGGGGQGHIAVILLEQTRQVFHPAKDVLLRQQGVADPELARRGGHQLGQSHGALAGDGQRIESGLGMDKCPDEGRLDLISLGCRLYGAGVVIEEEACRAPVDLGRRIAGIAVVEQQQFVVTLLRHHVGIAYDPVLLYRLVDLDLTACRLSGFRGGERRRGECHGTRRGNRGGDSRLRGQDHHLCRWRYLSRGCVGKQRHHAQQHPCFQRLAP